MFKVKFSFIKKKFYLTIFYNNEIWIMIASTSVRDTKKQMQLLKARIHACLYKSMFDLMSVSTKVIRLSYEVKMVWTVLCKPLQYRYM